MENSGGASIEVAGHWLAAREEARARAWLVEAAEGSRRVHAHRDVARALRQALELWPAAEAPDLRIEALESYAHSAELSGELPEAARAWREICAVRAEHGNRMACANAQRRLAAVHDLRADRDAAFAARNAAAEAFAAEECLAEAAVERLALANYLRAERELLGQHRPGGRSRERRRAGGPARPAPARAGAPGCGGGQGRGLPARRRHRSRGPRAGARARPHRGVRRSLPAPEHGALRRRRLPRGERDARSRAHALPGGRRGHARGLRHLPGLRAA